MLRYIDVEICICMGERNSNVPDALVNNSIEHDRRSISGASSPVFHDLMYTHVYIYGERTLYDSHDYTPYTNISIFVWIYKYVCIHIWIILYVSLCYRHRSSSAPRGHSTTIYSWRSSSLDETHTHWWKKKRNNSHAVSKWTRKTLESIIMPWHMNLDILVERGDIRLAKWNVPAFFHCSFLPIGL